MKYERSSMKTLGKVQQLWNRYKAPMAHTTCRGLANGNPDGLMRSCRFAPQDLMITQSNNYSLRSFRLELKEVVLHLKPPILDTRCLMFNTRPFKLETRSYMLHSSNRFPLPFLCILCYTKTTILPGSPTNTNKLRTQRIECLICGRTSTLRQVLNPHRKSYQYEHSKI